MQPRGHWIKSFSSGSPRNAPHPHRPVTNFRLADQQRSIHQCIVNTHRLKNFCDVAPLRYLKMFCEMAVLLSFAFCFSLTLCLMLDKPSRYFQALVQSNESFAPATFDSNELFDTSYLFRGIVFTSTSLWTTSFFPHAQDAPAASHMVQICLTALSISGSKSAAEHFLGERYAPVALVNLYLFEATMSCHSQQGGMLIASFSMAAPTLIAGFPVISVSCSYFTRAMIPPQQS